VFENRVLKRIIGHKRNEVTGGWREMHNEKLHELHSSPNITSVIKSKRMRWAGYVTCMGETGDAYKTFVRNHEVKISLGRSKCKWEDNIRVRIKEIVCNHVERIHLAQDRDQWWALVNTVMNLQVPYKAENLIR
jgi:hypothetical protein